LSKYLTQIFTSHCNAVICQQVTLSSDAEWPKVADAVIEALLPIHNPLRLAEELAMLDCLSGGRIISGFARGIPREYVAYNVSLEESRARFEEAWEIIKRAWNEEIFPYHGTFWSFQDVAIWPRPLQQPHPPVWVPVTGSKETLQWAARENVPITPGLGGPLGFRLDVVRFYAECLAQHGYQITPGPSRTAGESLCC
jgi:alkanesulfonate monooxygenase SsuD/methylene tetrahydromethanopterin reductase-like flavin-dependent oxidoreductase (luciferase family)